MSPGRLHAWPHSLVRWLFGRGEEEHAPTASADTVARFQNICISREAGAGAEDIARLVGQKLGWKVYDHELIEAIAHRMGVPLDEVRILDELAPSMVQDWLLPLREEYYAPQEAYLDHLAKLIEAIGRAGESILVGRGAGYMLPRETTLSVRVIAPLKVRALRLAERMGVSVRTARRAARDLDRRHLQFDRTMYRARLERPAQLRPGARLEQPRPGDRGRGHRPCRCGGPPQEHGDRSLAPQLVRSRDNTIGTADPRDGPMGGCPRTVRHAGPATAYRMRSATGGETRRENRSRVRLVTGKSYPNIDGKPGNEFRSREEFGRDNPVGLDRF